MLEIVLFCVNFGRGPRVDLRPPLLPWMKPLDTRVTRCCTERAAATHWAEAPGAMARLRRRGGSRRRRVGHSRAEHHVGRPRLVPWLRTV